MAKLIKYIIIPWTDEDEKLAESLTFPCIVQDIVSLGKDFEIAVPEDMVDNHSIVVRRNDLPSLDRP